MDVDAVQGVPWPVTGASPRVALLLGKPPERSPVLPEVMVALASRGADVRVHVPHEGEALPHWLADAGVVALRGVPADTLAAVKVLEASGLRCCNSAGATLAVRDRSGVHHALADAGIPIPAAADVPDADAARRWASGRPVVVKAHNAMVGRGAGIALWAEPDRASAPSFPGPYLVQEWVAGDGVDRKVYVIGDRLDALLKWRGTGRRSGERFSLDPALDHLARAVGACLGLRIFGVDVIEGPLGPVVVDVNAFPSCAGVPGAAAAIADTLLELAAR